MTRARSPRPPLRPEAHEALIELVTPTYSVIITAYNEEEYIAGAIRSVLAQTHDDFELIVVDDGSTDGTAAALQAYETDPRVTVIRQSNMGLSAARNTGIEASRGERIAFLDSDDLLMPGYLEAIDHAFKVLPNAGFVYTDAWSLQASTGRFYRASAMSRQHPPDDPPRDPVEFLRLLMHGNFIFVSATVNRSALEQVGDFSTSLTACEDYDLWIRLLSRGFKAIPAGGRLGVKRDRSTSMSRDSRNMIVNIREVYRRAVEEYDMDEDAKRTACDQMTKLDRMLATLDGKSPARAAWWRLRARLGAARRVVLRNRIWCSETPAEIAAAFPQLSRA
jgi:glycosyltransferase involved in cell wall biosynthesis